MVFDAGIQPVDSPWRRPRGLTARGVCDAEQQKASSMLMMGYGPSAALRAPAAPNPPDARRAAIDPLRHDATRGRPVGGFTHC